MGTKTYKHTGSAFYSEKRKSYLLFISLDTECVYAAEFKDIQAFIKALLTFIVKNGDSYLAANNDYNELKAIYNNADDIYQIPGIEFVIVTETTVTIYPHAIPIEDRPIFLLSLCKNNVLELSRSTFIE